MDYLSADYDKLRQARMQVVANYYGESFFKNKRVLELGCGHGQQAALMSYLGATVGAVDVRPEHIDEAEKKYSNIWYAVSDLDGQWPFNEKQRFHLILHTGLLNYLTNYEKSIVDCCKVAQHLVLEAEVIDSDNKYCCLSEGDTPSPFGGMTGKYVRPSAANIERILEECGMQYLMFPGHELNVAPCEYDWQAKNDGSARKGRRRLWFAERIKIENSKPV